MLSTKQLLINAKALIQEEKNWIKLIWYGDSEGVQTSVDRGVCFCIEGAIERALFDETKSLADVKPITEAKNLFKIANDNASPMQINDADETTHADVMAAMDKAINYELHDL